MVLISISDPLTLVNPTATFLFDLINWKSIDTEKENVLSGECPESVHFHSLNVDHKIKMYRECGSCRNIHITTQTDASWGDLH